MLALLTLAIGTVFSLCGVFLLLRGDSGVTSFTFKALGTETSFSEAAPGIVLVVLGFSLIALTMI